MLREGPQVSRTDAVDKRRLRVRMTYSELLRCVACGAGTVEYLYGKDRSEACSTTQTRQTRGIETSLRVHAGGSYVCISTEWLSVCVDACEWAHGRSIEGNL